MNKLLIIFALLSIIQIAMTAETDCFSTWTYEITATKETCQSDRGAVYGRGVGFPWKGSDGLSLKAAKKRCEKEHPILGCEKWGAVMYPKCIDGYFPSTCCTCQAKCPKYFDYGDDRSGKYTCSIYL